MMTKWIITAAVFAIALGSTTAHAKEKRRSQAVSGQIEKSKKNIEQNKTEGSEKIAAGTAKPKSSKASGVLKSAKCNQRQYPRPRKTSHLHPG